MKYILILPIIAFAMAALAVPSQRAASASQRRVALAPQQDTQQNTSGRKIPCKTPENAAMCYSTRGRLSFYNGNPPYRLWRIGTKRMLGIYSGPSVWPPKDQRDQDNPELPANLKGVFDALSNKIFADFDICPLEPERAGWMQHACIESAANIFVEK